MDNMELGEVQLRFAELVWHYAPLPSGELVKICQRVQPSRLTMSG